MNLPFATQLSSGYDALATETSVAGCRNPMTLGALALLKALFLCVAPLWRAMQGHRKVGRVPSSRFPTPASFASIPVGRDAANSSSSTRSLRHV